MKKRQTIKVGVFLSLLCVPMGIQAYTMGIVTATQLNIRSKPFIGAEVIKKVTDGAVLELIDEEIPVEGWYTVQTEDNKKAYVSSEFVKIASIEGTVIENNLNFRSYPSLVQSTILSKLPQGDKLTILYRVEDFYKVLYKGHFGFVYAPYIKTSFSSHIVTQELKEVKDITALYGISVFNKDDEKKEMVALQPEQEVLVPDLECNLEQQPPIDLSSTQIVTYALQFVGSPYAYGGNDLLTGVDCSGYTQQVMKAFNIFIPRTSKEQSEVGVQIENAALLQEGDFLFFGKNPEEINHVGIYIGNHKMVHASTSKTGIIVSDITEAGFEQIQVIRRMIV